MWWRQRATAATSGCYHGAIVQVRLHVELQVLVGPKLTPAYPKIRCVPGWLSWGYQDATGWSHGRADHSRH